MIYENEIRYVLCLLKCAVSDEIPPNPPENLDWEVIFKIAKKHKICNFSCCHDTIAKENLLCFKTAVK